MTPEKLISSTKAQSAVRDAAREKRPVIVAVHADDASVPSLQWAARSAGARGSTLEALMAWELPEVQGRSLDAAPAADRGVIADLRWVLKDLIDRSGISADPGLEVVTTVFEASAKVALVSAASRAALLVLGAPQHATVLAALSARRRIATHAPCPVAVVPVPGNQFDTAISGDRFVVGMDGSSQSIAALAWACAEADRRGLPVQVLAVGAQDAIPARVEQAIAAQQTEHPATIISLTTSGGDPGEVLAKESLGAEALVLGQHGNGWLSRRLPSLGSVSRWCVVHPVCPVVVVPLPRGED